MIQLAMRYSHMHCACQFVVVWQLLVVGVAMYQKVFQPKHSSCMSYNCCGHPSGCHSILTTGLQDNWFLCAFVLENCTSVGVLSAQTTMNAIQDVKTSIV